MVSIKDVAKVAGVSDKTVSRVANKESNVHPETVEKVNEAIRKLGYVPNMTARMMRSSRSTTFGIITDYVSTTPYSGDIVRGIQDWANENKKTVLMANTNGELERESETWRTFQEHRIQGVLFVTMYHRIIDPMPYSVQIPTVLVNSHPIKKRKYRSIEPDDYQGSTDLAKYVIQLGHRKIGYIRLNPALLGAELRIDAFRKVARDCGLSQADLTVRLGMEGPIGKETNWVYQEATEMLSGANRPTALVCGNDEMALQAYLAALRLGLRIPEDLTIVGFDDFKLISLGLKPQLTTVALPYYDLGLKGAQLLNRVLLGETPAAKHENLPCPLVVRGSSSAAPML